MTLLFQNWVGNDTTVSKPIAVTSMEALRNRHNSTKTGFGRLKMTQLFQNWLFLISTVCLLEFGRVSSQ